MAPDEVRRRLTLTVDSVLRRTGLDLSPGVGGRLDSVVTRLSTLVRGGRLSGDTAEDALRELLKRLRAGPHPTVFPEVRIRVDRPEHGFLTIGGRDPSWGLKTRSLVPLHFMSIAKAPSLVARHRGSTGKPRLAVSQPKGKPAAAHATKAKSATSRVKARSVSKARSAVRRVKAKSPTSPVKAGAAVRQLKGVRGASASPAASPGRVTGDTVIASDTQVRSAFPLLACESVVVAQREFPVRFGLSATQDSGVVGDPLDIPLSGRVTVQIVATGFTVRSGESLRHVLTVSEEQPYPEVTIHLTPEAQRPEVVTRALRAIYSVDARTVGTAVRAVSVVNDASLLDATPAPPQGQNHDVRVPAGATAPDVTIRLILDRAQAGQLTWAIETKYPDIHVPDEPPRTTIGSEPQAFARRLMQGINARQKTPRLSRYLCGVAKKIASKVPNELWVILREAARRAAEPPAVLLLSEEPYVPWELAYVEQPLADPAAPPFLGAQCNIGRWPLRTAKLPPPQAVDVSAVVVVSGVYDRAGWRRLKDAEDEARTLVATRFNGIAAPVNALASEISNCLDGRPPADLLHFAIHGTFDPNGLADGLVMVDGSFLDPLEVAGSTLERRPFVFLNACQVGQANTILGDYAGVAESFVSAGASGVIAPLWSVDDSAAREFALQFYAPSGQTVPAGVLRAGRVGTASAGPGSGTILAYQFYGHPALTLRLP